MRWLFIFCCCSLNLCGQSTFMKHYGGSNFDRALYLTHSKDGGYLLCGFSNSYNMGTTVPNYDLYLVKTDSKGNKEWEQTYGGTKMDLGWSVLEIQDGYLLHGCTRSRDSSNQDIILLKLNRKGELVWEKTYGNKFDERTTDMLSLRDGSYLLIGERIIEDSVNRDSYIIKIDPQGELIWEKTFGGPKVERTYYAAETAGGDYLISGSILQYDNNKADLLFLKVNSMGELLWTKIHGEKDVHEISHSFCMNADRKTFTANGYISSGTAGVHDALFIQIDANGNKLAQKSYHSGEDMRMMHGCQTRDGGFAVTGFTRKNMEKNIYDAVLLKYDKNGEVEWRRNFGSEEKDDQGYWIVEDKDGGYSLAGYTYSHGSNGDLWLIKTDAKGRLQ